MTEIDDIDWAAVRRDMKRQNKHRKEKADAIRSGRRTYREAKRFKVGMEVNWTERAIWYFGISPERVAQRKTIVSKPHDIQVELSTGEIWATYHLELADEAKASLDKDQSGDAGRPGDMGSPSEVAGGRLL